MKYKPSLFNIFGGLGFIALLAYTIYNWNVLSNAEGWGVVAMVFYLFIILAAYVIDLILQMIIKNAWLLNVVEIILLLVVYTLLKP